MRDPNPRPKRNTSERAGRTPRAKKKRASQRSAKAKEGRKKERKKERAHPSTSRSRAEYINFYEERLGFM